MMVDGKGVGRILEALMLSSPLTILFLGGGISKELAVWLEERGEKVFCTEEKVDARYVSEVRPDMILSYNYRHIITQDVLDITLRGAVNLHISYLPWNRGAHPNIWSFLEDSPKGVTIHYINEGIDTGDILLQEEVHIDEERETLGSSYGKLHQAIQVLFKRHWDHIRDRRIPARPQPSSGTLHFTTTKRWPAVRVIDLAERLRQAWI